MYYYILSDNHAVPNIKGIDYNSSSQKMWVDGLLVYL
jgi:hypothetical protein